MQKKVMDINLDGFHLAVIRTDDKRNPYRVYRIVNKYSRRLIAKYRDFISVLYFVKEIYTEGLDVVPLCDLVDWAKKWVV